MTTASKRAGTATGAQPTNTMKTNKPIAAGQSLTARCVTDHETTFHAFVHARKGGFATVQIMGETRRCKIHNAGDGEFIFALGRYSMAPVFRP